MKTKTLPLETKLAIVEKNSSRHGIAEAAIIREKLLRAERDFTQIRNLLSEQFDFNCWNAFACEFSAQEIESMAACERHRLNYENGEDEV